MIVVGMSPSRSVYLTRWNTYAAQSGHSKCRFFATTAESVAYSGERRRGAGIGGLVGYFFVTPVVYFKDSIFHRQAFYTVFEFGIELRPRHVEIFVVYTHRENKMPPFAVGDSRAPGHFLCRTKRSAYVCEVEILVVVEYIGSRHICIEELKSLPLVVCLCL